MDMTANTKISGKVVKGAGRGRGLGFPTANVTPPSDAVLPANGVYATKITIDGTIYNAITNIGNNPTFGENHKTIETHVFGLDADITGKTISLEILRFVRAERRFGSVDELVEQIQRDVEQVLNDFEMPPNTQND